MSSLISSFIIRNCLNFYSVLYFTVLTCIKYVCLCPPGDISEDVYVLYVCWCLFVKEQSILLVAQDPNQMKKINKLGVYSKNEPMQSNGFLSCFFIFLGSQFCLMAEITDKILMIDAGGYVCMWFKVSHTWNISQSFHNIYGCWELPAEVQMTILWSLCEQTKLIFIQLQTLKFRYMDVQQ